MHYKACLVTLVYTLVSVVQATKTKHTNNWAVIVDTSIFWFNYRHSANALSFYRSVKSLGIPDDQIILMLADDMACNSRNIRATEMFNNRAKEVELYGDDIEVDYRGEEVTVENFVRVLSGRHLPGTPASKRLDTDDGSNILIYMTGHGGDEFLKFKDSEEIGTQDIAECFQQMWDRKRYNEIFFAIDTCQAATMFKEFKSPNIVSIGSSKKGENSYSHHGDNKLGIAVIDRFTYYSLEYIEKQRKSKNIEKSTMLDFFRYFSYPFLHSNVEWSSTLDRPLDQVPLLDFFGSVLKVEKQTPLYPLEMNETKSSKTKDTTNSDQIWSNWPVVD